MRKKKKGSPVNPLSLSPLYHHLDKLSQQSVLNSVGFLLFTQHLVNSQNSKEHSNSNVRESCLPIFYCSQLENSYIKNHSQDQTIGCYHSILQKCESFSDSSAL